SHARYAEWPAPSVERVLRPLDRSTAGPPIGGPAVFGGRPRARLWTTILPPMRISPPHTPHGSDRSTAPARHSARAGHSWQSALAASRSRGDSEKNSSGSLVWHGSGLAGGAGRPGFGGSLGMMAVMSTEQPCDQRFTRSNARI